VGHAESNSSGDGLAHSGSVNGLLAFAVSSVLAFDRVVGGGKVRVLEELQSFAEVGRGQLSADLIELREAVEHAVPPQVLQLELRGEFAAAAIKELIPPIDELAQRRQQRKAASQPSYGAALGAGRVLADPGESIGPDLALEPGQGMIRRANLAGLGPSASPGRRFGQGLAKDRQDAQHRFVEFLEHLEHADLMASRTEDFGHGVTIHSQPVGGDAADLQTLQGLQELQAFGLAGGVGDLKSDPFL
jgi:hypothetical protein